MRNSLFFLLLTFLCFDCGKELTEESLGGLWYDEENNEELFFKNDSISDGIWGWPSIYKTTRSNEIIVFDHNNDTIDTYQFRQDTLFSDNNRATHIKIPFNSVIEYRLDKMGIDIDFFEGKVTRTNYSNKQSIVHSDFYVGNSKEDSTKKILTYKNRKYLLDTFEKVDTFDFIHVI